MAQRVQALSQKTLHHIPHIYNALLQKPYKCHPSFSLGKVVLVATAETAVFFF